MKQKVYLGDPQKYPNWFVKLDGQGRVPRETFWQRRAVSRTPFVGGGRSYAAHAFWKGMAFGGEGALLGLPFVALEAGMAQRGEVMPTVVARSFGLLSYPAISSVIAGGLGYAFPQLKFVGLLAGVASWYPDLVVQDSLLHGLRTATDAARSLRRLEVGGGYQDTLLAQNLRLTALTEMSGVIGASRRYLGQEARLMHR